MSIYLYAVSSVVLSLSLPPGSCSSSNLLREADIWKPALSDGRWIVLLPVGNQAPVASCSAFMVSGIDFLFLLQKVSSGLSLPPQRLDPIWCSFIWNHLMLHGWPGPNLPVCLLPAWPSHLPMNPLTVNLLKERETSRTTQLVFNQVPASVNLCCVHPDGSYD